MKGLFNQSNQIEKNNPIKVIDENHIPISIKSNPNKNNFFFNQKKSNIATSYLSIGSKIKQISIQKNNNLSNQNENKSQNNKKKYLSFQIKNKIKNSNNSNNTLTLKDSLNSNDNFYLFKEKNSYIKRDFKNKESKKKNLKIQLLKAETLKLKIKFSTISTERDNNYSRNKISNSKSNRKNLSHENEFKKKEKLKINLGNFVKKHNYCKTLISFNNSKNLNHSNNKKKNKSKTIYIKNFIKISYKSKNKTIEHIDENNKNNSLEYNLENIKLNLNPILDKIKNNNQMINRKNLTNLYEGNKINTLENNKNNDENNNSIQNNKYIKIENSSKKNIILSSNYKSKSKIKKKINQLDNELFNINNLNEINENFDDKVNDLYSLVKKLPFNSILVNNEDKIFSQKSILYQNYFKDFKKNFHKTFNFSNQKDKYGYISLSTQQNSTEKKTI